jgi:hypothetical protein
MERDVDLSCRAEYPIRGNKSIFNDADSVISPVGYLRKSDRSLAHKLPFRKIVARCRSVVGHINLRTGRHRHKFYGACGDTLGELVQQFRVGRDPFCFAV